MRRVLTALVGIPILLGAIWWGTPWLTILLALAVILGIREFYRLFDSPDDALPITLGGLWCLAFLVGGETADDLIALLTTSLGVLVVGAFISSLWLIAFYRGRQVLRASTYLILGPIYIGFLLAHVLALRGIGVDGELGRNWLLFALLVTFSTDTGAFLVGRTLGRHQMAPQVSPGKTWEGAAGGFILAIITSMVLGQILDLGLPRWQQGLIGATVGVVSQLGDLAESKLKRISRVKDTGSIIPGHGGILDRLDSLVFAIPTVYYLLTLGFKP